MARVHEFTKNFKLLIYFAVLLGFLTISVSANLELDEDNWREILEGEWMVEFYAPWCPACTALAPAWKELSVNAKFFSVLTAAVDVTKSPGLSGRFVVTALPTIFHVKHGEFRQYKGPRDVKSMLEWVQLGRWKQVEPVPGWKAPHSIQMSLVAEFFKLSQVLRGVHNMLMERYGLPTWGSYLIFAVATIFIGALLGLILVCVIDLLCPPKRGHKVFIKDMELTKKKEDTKDKSDDDQELLNDDILDDVENENDSDAEKNSPSDSSDEAEAAAEAAGDSRPDEKPAEVRKRRPRKAD